MSSGSLGCWCMLIHRIPRCMSGWLHHIHSSSGLIPGQSVAAPSVEPFQGTMCHYNSLLQQCKSCAPCHLAVWMADLVAYGPCLLCEAGIVSFLFLTTRPSWHPVSSCLCLRLDPCRQSRQLCGLHFPGMLACGSLVVQRRGSSCCELPAPWVVPSDPSLQQCNFPLVFPWWGFWLIFWLPYHV